MQVAFSVSENCVVDSIWLLHPPEGVGGSPSVLQESHSLLVT